MYFYFFNSSPGLNQKNSNNDESANAYTQQMFASKSNMDFIGLVFGQYKNGIAQCKKSMQNGRLFLSETLQSI